MLEAISERFLGVDIAFDQRQATRGGRGGLGQSHVDDVEFPVRPAQEAAPLVHIDVHVLIVIYVTIEVAILAHDARDGGVQLGSDYLLTADGESQQDIEPAARADEHDALWLELLEGHKADEGAQAVGELCEVPVKGHHIGRDLAVGIDIEVGFGIEVALVVGVGDYVGACEGVPLAADYLGMNPGLRKLLVQRLGVGVIGERHDGEIEIAVGDVARHQQAEYDGDSDGTDEGNRPPYGRRDNDRP